MDFQVEPKKQNNEAITPQSQDVAQPQDQPKYSPVAVEVAKETIELLQSQVKEIVQGGIQAGLLHSVALEGVKVEVATETKQQALSGNFTPQTDLTVLMPTLMGAGKK